MLLDLGGEEEEEREVRGEMEEKEEGGREGGEGGDGPPTADAAGPGPALRYLGRRPAPGDAGARGRGHLLLALRDGRDGTVQLLQRQELDQVEYCFGCLFCCIFFSLIICFSHCTLF